MNLLNKIIANFFKINIIIDCVLIALMTLATLLIPLDFIKNPKDVSLVNREFILNIIVFAGQIVLLFVFGIYNVLKKEYKRAGLSLVYIVILIVLIFANYILEALSLVKGL